LSLAVLSPAAAAADRNLPGIIGDDDREMADSTVEPWRAIGRLNHAGYRTYGHCTATLVGPDLVVTAAHCLFDPITGKRLSLKDFRFALGLRRDQYLELGKVRCALPNPGFEFNPKSPKPDLGDDSAVIVLENPMKEKPLPLSDDDPLEPGALVSHAGYGRDRRHVLSVHRNCHVLKADDKAALTDCDTNLGQSGGPILVERDGKYLLGGIMSGVIPNKASGFSRISAWRQLLDNPVCPR
jgi:V8-like Glu-specific endopeptidase